MGPYPHDEAKAEISDENPMGTDGFEFVEYASTEPEKLHTLFETMGFTAVARHRSRNVTLYRQGDIHLVLNAEPDSFAHRGEIDIAVSNVDHGSSQGAVVARPFKGRSGFGRDSGLHAPIG